MKNTVIFKKQGETNVLHDFDKAKIAQELADVLPNIPKERIQKMIETIEHQIDDKGEIRGVPLQEIIENAAIPDTHAGLHQRLEKAAKILGMSKSDMFSAENADIKNAILEMHAIGNTENIHGNPISTNQKKYIFEFSKEELIAKRNIGLKVSNGKLTKSQIESLMDHGIVGIVIWAIGIFILYGTYQTFMFLQNKQIKKSSEALSKSIIIRLNKYKKIFNQKSGIKAKKILQLIEIALQTKDNMELLKIYLDIECKVNEIIFDVYDDTYDDKYKDQYTYDTISYTDTKSLTHAYTLLGVTPLDNFETVKKTYRRLAIEKHPDKVNNESEEIKKKAKEEFQKLNAAYVEIKKANNRN